MSQVSSDERLLCNVLIGWLLSWLLVIFGVSNASAKIRKIFNVRDFFISATKKNFLDGQQGMEECSEGYQARPWCTIHCWASLLPNLAAFL